MRPCAFDLRHLDRKVANTETHDTAQHHYPTLSRDRPHGRTVHFSETEVAALEAKG